MSATTVRKSARLLSVGALLTVLLAWPIGVAAETGPGGNADLGLDGVTITATTVLPRTSLVTITGQIQCSADLDAFVWVDVNQVAGRHWTIQGGAETQVGCLAADGSAAFQVSFYASNGKFVPGRSRLEGFAETGSCTEEECLFDDVTFGPVGIRLARVH